ncbi:mCG10417, partial [Mus musculus]
LPCGGLLALHFHWKPSSPRVVTAHQPWQLRDMAKPSLVCKYWPSLAFSLNTEYLWCIYCFLTVKDPIKIFSISAEYNNLSSMFICM